MKVKDIMSKKIISLSPDDNVSDLISLIERYKFREIPIVYKKRLKGIIYSKDIVKKGITNPTKVKINRIMRFPPATVSPEQDLEDAANLIFKTGLRALPVIDKDKVIGMVSMHDIIEVVAKTKAFRQTLAETVMSFPEVVTYDNDIGKARILMREKNISRLPVVDKERKLLGIVTIFDLLKAVKPRERMGFYSMAAEKETIMGVPVTTIMNKTAVTVDKRESLNGIANLMSRYKTDGIVVVEDGIPVGIVTTKDLLEFYISGLKKKGVYYQIVGLEDEDDFIVKTIDRMIRDTIQKTYKIFKPQFFFLHIKRYDKKGRIKYSIRTRFLTNRGTFVSKAHAWDLRDAVDDALTKLEKIMFKKKDIRDKIREKLRFKKLFR